MGCELVNQAAKLANTKGLPPDQVVCTIECKGGLSCPFRLPVQVVDEESFLLGAQRRIANNIDDLSARQKEQGEEQLSKFMRRLKSWAARNPQAIHKQPPQKSKPIGWF